MRQLTLTLFWLGIGLMAACTGTPAPVETPAPTATASLPPNACERFGPFPASHSGAVTHQPPQPNLPPATPPAERPFRSAVHTLFLDETVADLAVAAGFDAIVQVFAWREINPEPGKYVWETADSMVRAARERDLELVVRLDMPPEWARREVNEGLPFDVAAYADFVTAVASRYQGSILGYIIWNEPNLAAEWSRSGGDLPTHWRSYDGWVADPADYVGVLGVAFRRIRAADAQALVLGGGLAPTNEFSPRAVDDRTFLAKMLQAGAAACMDILAVHSYGFGLSPDAARSSQAGLNLARIEDLRQIMLDHGVEKPVWITELGYTIQSEQHPPVSLKNQAEYLVAALERTRTDWPWVEMLTVWNLVYGRNPDDEMSGYSLVEPDLTPRPAYIRLQQINQ